MPPAETTQNALNFSSSLAQPSTTTESSSYQFPTFDSISELEREVLDKVRIIGSYPVTKLIFTQALKPLDKLRGFSAHAIVRSSSTRHKL